jgi:hypothetical protein
LINSCTPACLALADQIDSLRHGADKTADRSARRQPLANQDGLWMPSFIRISPVRFLHASRAKVAYQSAYKLVGLDQNVS